jgi:teichuronic acid biosynthesis glycosyltransferase TuaG
MELVSVILPYYKKEKYLKDTLKSIINQTYKNLEIIIVNDELSSKSFRILDKFKNFDKRIKIVINKKNLGAGGSRNKAIELSRGSYIAFCDCDDLWTSKKVEIQLAYMKKMNLDFCHTKYQILTENGDKLSVRDVKHTMTFDHLIKSCDIGLSTVMIKSHIFKNKDLRFGTTKTKEDFILWLKLAQHNVKLSGLKKNLTYWKKTRKSLSSSFSQKIFDGYRVYRFNLNFNPIKSLFYLFLLSINFLLKN